MTDFTFTSLEEYNIAFRAGTFAPVLQIEDKKYQYVGEYSPSILDIARGESKHLALFETENKHSYEIIKDEYKRLYERTITMTEGNTTINFRWVEAINFNKETKTLSLKWSSTIIPYISELRENFSRLAMVDIAKIEGSYASRLFDFIFQEKYKGHKGTKEIDIKDLIYLWCIPTSLQKVAELKRIILNPAIKELARKKLIDIALTNGKKNGKTITSLIFNYRFCK